MSLRELGVYGPLKSDHPLVADGDSCWKCGTIFAAGMRVALNPIETPDQSGSLTVLARPVCATCHLRGREIRTPIGRRIIERIKDGDGSSYPVITTDHRQWQDTEIRALVAV